MLDKYIPHLLPNQLWIFTADLVRGLNWIHSRRLVHLDLKPGTVVPFYICLFYVANIFLYGPNCESYRAQIGDYGTMEKWEESTSGDGDGKYLAPERLDETSYRADPSADIFSLGLTVWAMAMKREVSSHNYCYLPPEAKAGRLGEDNRDAWNADLFFASWAAKVTQTVTETEAWRKTQHHEVAARRYDKEVCRNCK